MDIWNKAVKRCDSITHHAKARVPCPGCVNATAEAQLAAANERAERAEHEIMRGAGQWPMTVAKLEEALSTFPAGRLFLDQWTKAEQKADRAEAASAAMREAFCAYHNADDCKAEKRAGSCAACAALATDAGAAYAERMRAAEELIAVLESRLERFEDIEDDAIAVAKWARAVATDGSSIRAAATRYLSGITNDRALSPAKVTPEEKP